MPQKPVYNRLFITATATYLLVTLGAVVRALGGLEWNSVTILDASFRIVAVVAALGALAAIWAALSGPGRPGGRKPTFVLGFGLIATAAIPLAVSGAIGGGPLSGFELHLTVGMAFIATGLLAAAVSGGSQPYHSRLSMFQSQWQVPLYAAVAGYIVTILGSYLKSVGPAATCGSWPLCTDFLKGDLSTVAIAHLAHRAAALAAGLMLVYTVVFVWKRHLNRPTLLVLTGSAVVFYAAQIVLGAEAARLELSSFGSFLHVLIASAFICTLVGVSVVGYYAPSLPSIAGAEVAFAMPAVRPFGEVARDYWATTKPRILVLLVITAYAAMWVAAKGVPNIQLTIITVIGLGMSCGAANAINMWYDRDIDVIMNRTKRRPIPSGRLSPGQVLGFGVLTGALSFVLLALAVNLLTAVLSLAGLLFYVLIYTMWLKRSTDLNTVIGGACGAVPPMVGWAAVTGHLGWAPIVMFLIMFVWQPPHFWALALYRNEDYRAAKIPMLPVTKGEMHTKWQILIYSVLLFPTVAALYWTGAVGPVYLWVSLAVTAVYLVANVMLFRERLPMERWARRSFFWSLYWLTCVFFAAVLDITH